MIIDAVPWNEYRQRVFPDPEELLTCQQVLNVCNRIHTKRNAEYLF